MKAYSLDLRQRIFSYSLTHSIRETAHIFQVSPSTVQELKRLFIETGTLDRRPPGAAPFRRKANCISKPCCVKPWTLP